MKQVQSVTVPSDSNEEIQAMQALIQRWSMNGWIVKNISEFARSEGWSGHVNSRYSTIIFEKEDASFCPICNVTVNDMILHRQWHTKRESSPPKTNP